MRAAAAAEIAGTVMPARRSEMFTAALLQDMAQPVLFHTNPDYVHLTSSWEGPHVDLASRETDAFGWTHAEVGSLMCMHWDLPELLTEAISVHHDDHDDGFAIVQWAAMVERHEDRLDHARDAAAERFGIGQSEAAALLERAAERAGEIAGAFA
jgi:HD-like signal output (HDOD) protein